MIFSVTPSIHFASYSYSCLHNVAEVSNYRVQAHPESFPDKSLFWIARDTPPIQNTLRIGKHSRTSWRETPKKETSCHSGSGQPCTQKFRILLHSANCCKSRLQPSAVPLFPMHSFVSRPRYFNPSKRLRHNLSDNLCTYLCQALREICGDNILHV